MLVGSAPVAESVPCAIGFTCRPLRIGLRSAARGYVLWPPGGSAQVHWFFVAYGRQLWCVAGWYARGRVGWQGVRFSFEVRGIHLAALIIAGTDKIQKLGKFCGHVFALRE